nr:MAG TPA: hypothetical protein [Caudoviricetes sp.]
MWTVCCVRDCPSVSDSEKAASPGNSTVPGNRMLGASDEDLCNAGGHA